MSYQSYPSIRHAAHHIASGGVVAYPTEGVWGLGADPRNRHAVMKILELKRRPIEKGVILVAATIDQFEFILRHLDAAQRAVLEASWPGPNTWLVPHYNEVANWVCGDHSTVALRVSAHPVVRALCERTGPLVSTSANPQGLPPARHGFKARRYFGDQVFYVPGQVHQNAKPSTIRDLMTGAVVRA